MSMCAGAGCTMMCLIFVRALLKAIHDFYTEQFSLKKGLALYCITVQNSTNECEAQEKQKIRDTHQRHANLAS